MLNCYSIVSTCFHIFPAKQYKYGHTIWIGMAILNLLLQSLLFQRRWHAHVTEDLHPLFHYQCCILRGARIQLSLLFLKAGLAHQCKRGHLAFLHTRLIKRIDA